MCSPQVTLIVVEDTSFAHQNIQSIVVVPVSMTSAKDICNVAFEIMATNVDIIDNFCATLPRYQQQMNGTSL